MFSSGQVPDQAVNYTNALAVCGKNATGDDPVRTNNRTNLTLPQILPCSSPIGAKWIASLTNWLCFLIDGAGLEYRSGEVCQDPFLLLDAVLALIPPANGLVPLEAPLVLYVYTTGNDANDGLTPATALATLTHAYHIFLSFFLNGFSATIVMGPGTFNQSLRASAMPVGVASIESIILTGQLGLTTLNGGADAAITLEGPTSLVIENLICQTVSNIVVLSSNTAFMQFGPGMVFGCAGSVNSPVIAATTVASISFADDWSMVAGANGSHNLLGAVNNSNIIMQNITITLVGTPDFTNQATVAASASSSINLNACTFVGGATGPRYFAFLASSIYTNGAGATFIPGSSSGSVSGNGFYF